MAEPNNTPVPASTPRSASPATVPNTNTAHLTPSAVPPPSSPKTSRLRVLHIGDPVRYNLETFASFSAQCDIIRPSTPERQRPAFVQALKERRWGDFHAVFRPFWGSGGEMGMWDEELVGLLPRTVRVFASAGAGYDWADTKVMGEKGIVYCNSGLAAAEAVADFAVAMIISTFRQLPWCITAATSCDPSAFTACHQHVTAQAHNLRGRILGLVGFGNIGQQVAARCRHGFGMEIHYYDVVRKGRDVEDKVCAVAHGTLEGLLGVADCVVLCAPAGRGGETIVNARTLPLFRPGARLVNVARGCLVDEEALADALEDEGCTLGSVALDVFADEPRVSERLVRLARKTTGSGGSGGRRSVMLTCHNAGGTVETHEGFEELSMRNVMDVLGGGRGITPVNEDVVRGQR